MKRVVLIILGLLLLTLSLFAEEEAQRKFSFDSKATFVNNYYWRGSYLYPEGVPAFQPEATITYNKVPVYFNIWSSVPLKKRAELESVKDELDFALSGDISITEKLTLTVGIQEYAYPFTPIFSHSEELYGILFYELPQGFGLELDTYVSVNDPWYGRGIYLGFYPTYQTALNEELDLKLQMLLGYTNYTLLKPQFKELGLRSQLNWQFSKHFYLTATLIYDYNYSAAKNLYAASLGLGFNI